MVSHRSSANASSCKHIVNPGCLHVASKTFNPVKSMQPPTNVTQLRSFLGLHNVYSRFVSNFAQIAAPLTNKLRNYNRHTYPDMNKAEMNSLQHLKEALVKPPVLALPRCDQTYVLNAAFPLPRPIVNENSEFFSDCPAYHPSETAAAQSPVHISRHELDPKNQVCSRPISAR